MRGVQPQWCNVQTTHRQMSSAQHTLTQAQPDMPRLSTVAGSYCVEYSHHLPWLRLVGMGESLREGFCTKSITEMIRE
jgi:hypothetical protein